MKYFLFIITVLGLSLGFIVPPLHASNSARFYLGQSSGNYTVGDTITVSLMVDSGGQAINAAEGTISYSTGQLDYQSISTSGSIFTFWTSGPSENSGTITFGGGLSSPGYSGSSGKILTVTWKAKASGSGGVTVNGSKILANDGVGTNIYGSSSGGTYTINDAAAAPTVTKTPKATVVTVQSSSHPDQQHWYTDKNIILSWSASAAVSGYSFVLDQSASTDPSAGVVSDKTKTYANTADGVWYFHIQAKTDSGFTPVVNYKIQIDTTSPDSFAVTVQQDSGSVDPQPKITFASKDALSGIDHYTASINQGTEFTVNSGDKLPKQLPGSYTVVVKAIDKAGNSTTAQAAFTIQGIASPSATTSTSTVGLLEGVHFAGEASPDDIIHIYLNGKEVDHFTAKDKQVAFGSNNTTAYAADGKINWEYIYTAPLLPGNYSFQFRTTDVHGAESALSAAVQITVAANTIKISGHTYTMRSILIIFVLILLIFLVIIAMLLVKIYYISRSAWAAVRNIVKGRFSSTKKTLTRKVDDDIPDQALTKDQTVIAKREVAKDIEQTIDDEIKKLD